MHDTYYKIESPFGNLWVVPTQKDHIYLSCGHNINDPKEYPEGTRQGPLVINKVDYCVNCHFYLWKDGKWHIGMENDNASRIGCLYLSKVNYHNPSDRFPWAAYKKITEQLPLYINQWAMENFDKIALAHLEHLNDVMEKKLQEIHDAGEKLKTLTTEYEMLGKEWRAYKDANDSLLLDTKSAS